MLLSPTERRESGAIIPSTSQTQTNAQPSIPRPVRVPDGTLRLRGGPVEDRRVRWGADVIDNEGLGRKKSKVCCIYHRPRAYDESSSDDSDSSSDDDSDASDDRHGKDCGHGHGSMRNSRSKGKGKTSKRGPSPNAYEKMPKTKKKA